MTDWNLLRIQYEVFGATVAELVREFGVSEHTVNYAIEKEGWKQLPIAKAAQEWQDIDNVCNVTDEVLEGVAKRLEILQTVKRSHLSPQYHMLEASILSKAREIVENLDPKLVTASNQLKQIVESMALLGEKTGAVASGRADENNKGITLKILTQVGGQTAVQLET